MNEFDFRHIAKQAVLDYAYALSKLVGEPIEVFLKRNNEEIHQ